jgi:hypothetical protein
MEGKKRWNETTDFADGTDGKKKGMGSHSVRVLPRGSAGIQMLRLLKGR